MSLQRVLAVTDPTSGTQARLSPQVGFVGTPVQSSNEFLPAAARVRTGLAMRPSIAWVAVLATVSGLLAARLVTLGSSCRANWHVQSFDDAARTWVWPSLGFFS